jgi:hypothetical protein
MNKLSWMKYDRQEDPRKKADDVRRARKKKTWKKYDGQDPKKKRG